MASSKKKQDEKHLKILREMVALAHNKQCFDCHQRGPTYINMTIGSYVCTACSGLLRGLNPPHRVKSISMASFTPEEMDFIKSRGNEFCRKVWLGLYDNRLGTQAESREESKVKDFMAQKYERKRYYVAPTETMIEEAKRMNESAISKTPGTRPLKSLLGENAPKIQLGNHQPKPVSATPPPINSTPQSPGNQSIQSSKSSGSTAMDLLGDLGGDPFASSTPQAQTTGGFADFGNFGNTGSQSNSGFPPASQTAGFPPATQQTSQPPPFAQSTPLQPLGSTSSSSNNSQLLNGSVAPPAPAAGGDKYSNLSDLFSMATTTESEPATSTGWGLSSTNTSGGINWNSGSSAPSSGGINWGGDSSSSTNMGGVNWNSSSASHSSSSNTSMGWGGVSTSNVASTGMSAMSWGGTPATAQTNVSNPFGGSSGTSLTTQSSMGTAGANNPFGGQVPGAQQGGFGAYGSQAGGFGQFGAQQNTAVNSTTGGQFGQFGVMQNGAGFGAMTSTGGFGNVQTTTQAGFRQPTQPFAAQPGFGQQQPGVAGFGAMPQSGFGAQSAGFGQPGYGAQPQQMTQGFGGWGQQAPVSSTANPFMSTVQQYSAAPKSGATNPFL